MSAPAEKQTSASVSTLPIDGEVIQDDKSSPAPMARLGWIIVLVGFVGFLVWASLAPLDRGVPAPGVVVVDGSRKAVQHPAGGIVKAIHVRDGSTVKAGDILLSLNDVTFKAAKDIALSQWVNARAREARLIAELSGADEIDYPEALLRRSDEALVSRTLDLQRQLLKSRRQVLTAELSAIEENIRGVQAQINALVLANQGRERELAAVSAQRESLVGLAADGYVSRNRLLELDRSQAQLEGQLASNRGERGRLLSQLAELKLALAQRRSEAVREAQTELTEMQREADSALGRLVAAEFDLSNVDVRAPADGVVVGMTVFTEGGVIGGGDRLMEIVPEDQPLEVDAQVPVNLVDSVTVGLPVDLMFTGLNLNVTPIVNGEVIHVSADRLTNPDTGVPYYKATVRATEEGVQQLKGQKVRPGMAVEVFIKTGERSFMNYLFKPLRDRAATALTEE